MLDEALLVEAKKYIPDPNYILNLYDMGIEWVNTKQMGFSGYTEEELLSMRNVDIVDAASDDDTRQKTLSSMVKDHGTDKIVFKIKNGQTVLATVEFKTFMFGKVMYFVGK